MDRAFEQVKKDIEKYRTTGKLPQSYDVVQAGQGGACDYWDWVDRMTGGQEPLWNSGDSELAGDDAPCGTDNGARFRDWLAEELPKLSDGEQELFKLAYVQRLTQENLATYYRVDQATISRRLDRLKAGIMEYLRM